MLAVDLAEVRDEEGVFIARVAHLMVDGLDTLVESLANELLWSNHAMLLKRFLVDGPL